MTNKKLWLSLLAVVLIVCMLSVSLVACKKDDDSSDSGKKKTPTKSIELQAIEAIVAGVKASVEDGDMTDLTVDGSLGLKINDTEYSLDLALDLDLLQYTGWEYTAASSYSKGTEYYVADGQDYKKVDISEFESGVTYYTRAKKGVETKTKSNTFINAELNKGDETLLGLYYWDSNSSEVVAGKEFTGDMLYLQYKDRATQSQKMMRFSAPYVNATMKKLNASVNFSDIDLGDEGVWGQLDTYLGIVAGLAEGGELTSKKASVTLNIGTLLDPNNENNLLTLVSGIQSYFDNLNLDIDAEQLGTILPNITLTLSADLDNGKATGFDISLGIKEKDIVIKNKTVEHTLLDIEMDKDIDITLSLDYEIGGEPDQFYPDGIGSWPKMDNIIDVELSVDLAIDQSVGISFKLNEGTPDEKEISVALPAGSYTFSIYLEGKPFEILDDIDDLSFDSVGAIMTTAEKILDVVTGAEIRLHRTKDGDGNTIDENTLWLAIGPQYTSGTKGDVLKATLIMSSGVIAGLTIPPIEGMEMTGESGLIKTVKGIIDGVLKPSDEDPYLEEDATTKTLKEVAKYLVAAYIGINDGKTGHGDIYAEFDSADTVYKYIPFGGYTEWQGAHDAEFEYYTKTEGEWSKAATFDANAAYYDLVEDDYRPVGDDEAYDPYRKYYNASTHADETSSTNESNYKTKVILVKGGYKYVALTADTFVANKYYVKGEDTYTSVGKNPVFTAGHPTYYVKGISDGGDMGIGLKASVFVTFNDDDATDAVSLGINAEVKNLNCFSSALPKTLNVSISNLKIRLFQNNYPVLTDDSSKPIARENDMKA